MTPEAESTSTAASVEASSTSLETTFWVTIGLSLAVIIATVITILHWRQSRIGQIQGPTLAGVFGDFLSGFLGPLLSLVSIYFVVVTLREQRETTLDERQAEKVEGFENRFYRLIELHRDNVSEMSLLPLRKGGQPTTGKRVFLSIVTEIQTALIVIRRKNVASQLNLSTIDELLVAYYCVFFGIGSNSLEPLVHAFVNGGSTLGAEAISSIEEGLEKARSPLDVYYKFDGHQVRLGHYYRHLFQAIDYVHNQKMISEDEKISYIKTLRAQLSTHEQMLLLVNSLTPLGWRWWNEGFLEDYGLIKNIPAGMLERYCGIDVCGLFDAGYWEYEDANPRPAKLDLLKRREIV